mmetsp:Transcript_9835/g.17826  ORF Transcript_9835/g.17826 Transcript_9835/m.17826 type:complete len:524 (+) Transcript_9835:44-1615(+)
MSAISDWLKKAFGRKYEYRVLTWGFYGGGSTTGLYQLKLGEAVTTMPTIGFNVETIEMRGAALTMWDLGGRDRIRPLWRHYFENTQALIFYVDSTERGSEHHEFMRDELDRFLREDELRGVPVLICANKQDLPDAMTTTEVIEALRLSEVVGRAWYVQATCAKTGDGLKEGVEWLLKNMHKSDTGISAKAVESGKSWLGSLFAEGAEKSQASIVTDQAKTEASGASKTITDSRQEAVLTGVLAENLESDEAFIGRFESSSLDLWDHVSLLRLMWLLLTRYGRTGGKDRIFGGLSRDGANPFPETLAYFWMHMVHYAMVATMNPSGDFKGFLVLNPQLCDANLASQYYSDSILTMTPEARTEVILPDKQALPSLISSHAPKSGAPDIKAKLAPELEDEEYLERLEARTLQSWGHDAKLRAIWCLVRRHGRRQGGTSKVLQALKEYEGEAHNVTESYFWVQMVTLKMAEAPAVAGFDALMQRGSCLALHRSDFVLEFYSEEVIIAGATEFKLPDKKPMPNIVQRG